VGGGGGGGGRRRRGRGNTRQRRRRPTAETTPPKFAQKNPVVCVKDKWVKGTEERMRKTRREAETRGKDEGREVRRRSQEEGKNKVKRGEIESEEELVTHTQGAGRTGGATRREIKRECLLFCFPDAASGFPPSLVMFHVPLLPFSSSSSSSFFFFLLCRHPVRYSSSLCLSVCLSPPPPAPPSCFTFSPTLPPVRAHSRS